MKIEIERTKKFPIIVSQEELQKLSDFLSDNYSELEFEFRCIDGSTLTSDNIEEIINFENPSSRRIKTIEVKFGRPYSLGGIVSFGEKLFETCSMSVNETDDLKALKIAREVEFRLNECKTWYSWLMYIRPFSLAIIIPVLIFTIAKWREFFQNDYKLSSSDISVSGFSDIFYIMLPFLLTFVILIYFADKYWFWIFPKVWFEIGKQKIELQKRIKVRNWIFGGIILTIILSIIGNLLTNLIAK